MATPQKKFLGALDPQFILCLEAGAQACQSIFDGLAAWGLEFILTETGLQEIQEMAESGSRPEFQELAKRTLPKLRSFYGIKTPGLRTVENGCAEIIANTLLEKCLPMGADKDDALLIAEASLHECDFLVMLLNPITGVDSQKMNLVMIEKGGNPLSVVSAEGILAVIQKS